MMGNKVCPRCESTLEKGYCPKCKINEETYEKIMRASKAFYDKGIMKARSRDLSGAVEMLKRSLKLNKYNIDARNLLGLVYYELGEFVYALREWVISRNFQSDENIATDYIKAIQENKTTLEKLDSAFHKYNKALEDAKTKSTDIAIIQLKKVTAMVPNFVKAYLLLALIYINEDKVELAKKELVKVLKIDKTNYVAKKYFSELNGEEEDVVIISPEEQAKIDRKKAKKQIIINQTVQQFLGVVFGLIVGFGVMFFLVMPNHANNMERELSDTKKQLVDVNSQMASLIDDSKSKDAFIKELQQQVEDEKNKSEVLKKSNSNIDLIMEALNLYFAGNKIETAKILADIDTSVIVDTNILDLYNKLKADVYPVVINTSYKNGVAHYGAGNYEQGIESLLLAEKLMTNEAIADNISYYLGRCYWKLGMNDEAKPRFEYVIKNTNESDLRKWATNSLSTIR